MIKVPHGTKTITKYPFHLGKITVGVYGKPEDWKEVISNIQDAQAYGALYDKVYNLGQPGEKSVVWPRPVHKTDITSSRQMRALSVKESQLPIFRGTDADGAEVEPDEVYALASGDCPTLVIHDVRTLYTIALHFNRENGVDGSILEMALEKFSGSRRDDLVAIISCGISPEHFDHNWGHEKFGESNRRRTERVLLEYGTGAISAPFSDGGINLRYIAARKLLAAGIQSEKIFIDQIDTYSDPRFWSHRASNNPNSPKYGETGRNLVLVGVS